MKGDDRKAATAAYKDRKDVVGIYAVRCSASGEIWAGQSLNLDTIQNRLWFTLRLGNNPQQGLQNAWRDHGAKSFTFEVLERLADEESPYVRDALLKERMLYWRSTLEAQPI